MPHGIEEVCSVSQVFGVVCVVWCGVCGVYQHKVCCVWCVEWHVVCVALSNVAGSLPLEEVAVLFDGATLVQLKEECGGLQTLLRNHHQVFEGVYSCIGMSGVHSLVEKVRYDVVASLRCRV